MGCKEKQPVPSCISKMLLHCFPSLALRFKGADDYTCTLVIYPDEYDCSIGRGFLEQLQVKRFTNEYSSGYLKGILEEGAVKAAPVVYDTGC